MPLVFLRTDDGRFLAAGEEPDSPARIVDEPLDCFESEEAGEGGPKLRSLLTGRYLDASVTPDAVVLRNTAEGFPKRFRAEAMLETGDGCCGPRFVGRPGAVEPAWKDHAHKHALLWAALLLTPGLSNEAREFQQLWSNPVFKQGVVDGLHAADFQDPWRGTHVGIFYRSFDNHFYDPVRKNNFYENHWTALCDGRRYFNMAVHMGRRMKKLWPDAPDDLIRATAFNLGLSVHFLSDLTQPMHTANFTNYYGAYFEDRNQSSADKRHEGFEEAGDRWVGRNRYPEHYRTRPLESKDVSLDGIADSGTLLTAAAEAVRPVYVQHVQKIAASKKIRIHEDFDYIKEWKDSEASPALELSLLHTPKVIARYFAFWTSRVLRDQTITDKKWYQVQLLDDDVPLRIKDGEIHVGKKGDESFESQFCFVFNASGTWTVICRAALAKAWHMSRGLESLLVTRDYEPGTPPDAHSQFRLVPFGPGRENAFWIFERTFEANGDPEVVGLDGGTGPKIKRNRPAYETTQLFRLREMGDIHVSVQEMVRNIWPQYGQHRWWGSER